MPLALSPDTQLIDMLTGDSGQPHSLQGGSCLYLRKQNSQITLWNQSALRTSEATEPLEKPPKKCYRTHTLSLSTQSFTVFLLMQFFSSILETEPRTFILSYFHSHPTPFVCLFVYCFVLFCFV